MKKNLLVARAVLEGSNSEASRILDEFDGPKMFPYLNHTTQAEISKWIDVELNIVRNTTVIRRLLPTTKQMIKSCDAMKEIANRRGLRFKTIGQRTVRFFNSDLSDEHYIDITFGAGDKVHLYSSAATLAIVVSLCDKNDLCAMIHEYVCNDEYYKGMIARVESVIEVESEEKRKAKKEAKENKSVEEFIDTDVKSRSEGDLEPLRDMANTEECNTKEVLEISETISKAVSETNAEEIDVISLTYEGLAKIIKTVAEEVAAATTIRCKSLHTT